jgi:hypothetical protein
VFLKDVQIGDTILDELRADELTRCMPSLSISSEDTYVKSAFHFLLVLVLLTISQEIMPFMVKLCTFAIIIELSGKNGLDIFLIGSHN